MSIIVIFPRKDLLMAQAYRLLRKAVYDVAAAQVFADGVNCGLLGMVLPEAEYLLLPNVEGAFVEPLYPGDFPAAAAAAAAQKV
jgi:hypothetical protein